MRITRLEIFGFKSFRDRFVLTFDRDLIGVVGPNGCGKSNIIDALRWVLGENQARQLRGTTQEDLIFNGSDTRKPLGMAEVSISFKTDPGWVPALGEELDAEEIALIERLTALGMSDMAGEQVGATAQSAEKQGAPDKADKVVVDKVRIEESSDPESINPQETQSVETSGDSSQEKSAKLAEIRQAIFSVPSIFEAAEIQITRRLYRSGENEYFINRVPCRLRDVVDLCRTIGLGPRGLNIVQQGSIGEIITKKPIERRELLEEAAGISGFRTRLETALRQVGRTQENLGRLRDLCEEVGKQVRILKRQAAKARARAEQKSKLRDVEDRLFSLKIRNLELARKGAIRKIDECQNTECLAVEEERALQGKLREVLDKAAHLASSLESQRGERRVVQKQLEEEREREQSVALELARIETRCRSEEQSRAALEERFQGLGKVIEDRRQALVDIANRISTVVENKEISEKELGDLQRKLELAHNEEENGVGSPFAEEMASLAKRVESLPELSQAISELMLQLDGARKTLRQKREAMGSLHVKEARVKGEISSIESQLKKMAEHVAQSVGGDNQPAEESVLLAGLDVPDDYHKAAFAVLGDKGKFLVANDSRSLLARYGQRQSSKESRIGVLDKRLNVGNSQVVLTSEMTEAAPSAKILRRVMGVEKGLEPLADYFFASTIVVDTLGEAERLASLFEQAGTRSVNIVTKSGEVISEWGWCTTTGSNVEMGFLPRLEELRSELKGLEEGIGPLLAEVSSLEEWISCSEVERSRLEEDRRKISQEQKRLSQLQQVVRDNQKRERSQAIERERSAQSRVRHLAEQIASLSSQRDGEERRIGEQEAERQDICRRVERAKENSVRLKLEYEETLNTLRSIQTDEAGQQTVGDLKGKLSSFDEAITKTEAALTELRREGDNLRAASDHVRSWREKLAFQLNQAMLELERSKIEEEFLIEQFQRYYGPEAAIPSHAEISAMDKSDTQSPASADLQGSIESLDKESTEIRRVLERDGEVDPEAITRYAEEEARLENLTAQMRDLEQAVQTLEKTISYLKEISRVKFLRTFEFVSRKFAELVPRLFGGGMGKMELVNPGDPLTSGVALTVRPPGKQLKSLELLSGGEKALGALAILISMFLHRPGPLCVMDEVDAPLDDANLGKFMDLVREISSATQFLVVTHNKQTMAAVDRLIGITMQEKGVSSSLEVKLEDAEYELDNWALTQ